MPSVSRFGKAGIEPSTGSAATPSCEAVTAVRQRFRDGPNQVSSFVRFDIWDDLVMPPDDPLMEEQIHTIEKWIEHGKVWPDEHIQEIDAADRMSHWAFSNPLNSSQLRQSKMTRGQKTPIDRFILRKLRSGRLEPTRPADRRTLIRRATFDLHGVPPTPSEVDGVFARQIAGCLRSCH